MVKKSPSKSPTVRAELVEACHGPVDVALCQSGMRFDRLSANGLIRRFLERVLIFILLTLQAGLLHAQFSVTANASSCASTGVGSLAWTNPANAATGTGYATATGTGTTQYLQCSGFNFSAVPGNAAVAGIRVNVKGNSSAGTGTDAHVRVGKNSSSLLPTDGATGTIYPASDTTVSYGSASSLWGGTWVPSDLNSLNTSFSASLTSGTFSVDAVTATASYWLPPVLTVQAGASSGAVGGVVAFTLTVKNTNSAALTNLVVTTTLSSGLTYKTNALSPPDLSTVSNSGQTVTWTIPSLDPGTTYTMSLVTQLAAKGVQSVVVNGTAVTPNAALVISDAATASVLVLAQAVTHYQMDEPVGTWKGTTGEVIDSGGTQLHGTRVTTGTSTTTNTVVPNPTIESSTAVTGATVTGSFCNAGKFDGNAVVQTPSSPLFQYSTTFSASAWIYPTSYPSSDLMAILSNDVNYEFHLNPQGHLYWWWNVATLTSQSVIPLNQWSHIAITFDSSPTGGRQRIYINGVLDANVNTWKGTLQINTCPFYVGGDIYTDGHCTPATGRNFKGMIDEAKLYNYELSASEVQADMTLGRLCSGIFDHVQLEIASDATVCTPATVVVKACLDAACKTLYPGNVVVNLSPATAGNLAWIGGDTFTLTNGIATKQLSSSDVGNVTIGTVSATPNPGGGTQCFKNGVASNCSINFASTSCAFDVVEVGADPGTHIYTKLAGQSFSLDLLALKANGQIDTGNKTSNVQVDVVDTSSSACPSSGSVLASGGKVSFLASDHGRKTVTFISTGAAKVASGRALASGTASCSSDKFAIRPTAFTVTSTNANADGTGSGYANATPIVKAGSPFNISVQAVNAAGNAAAGYNGTPTVDRTATATAYRPPTSPGYNGTLTGTFGGGNSSGVASGDAFTYSEVGYFSLPQNFVYDDSFTAIDSGLGDCTDDFSNAAVGGKFGCKFGNSDAPIFGRFVPDHFAVSGGTLTSQRAPAATFSYMGEPMNATFTLTAQNAANNTTQNYAGAYAKLAVALPATFNFAFDNGAPATVANAVTSSCAGNLCATWNKGLAATTASLVLARDANSMGPYETLRLGIAPVDSDGVAMNTLDMDTAAPTGNDHKSVATTKARFGVIRLGNAYGSEVLPLRVPVEAQYWNGSLFQTNYDDSSTSFTSGNFLMSNCLGGIASNTACASNHTALSPANITLVNGRANLMLSAPGLGHAGSLDLCLDLGADAHGPTYTCSATSAGMSYLQGPWGGATNDYDPKSRATFGIYKRNNEMIYLRENY